MSALARGLTLCLLALCFGCADERDDGASGPSVVVVTFNTGTSEGMGHDASPDDGYGSAEAALSDQYYGDGLAWSAVVEDTRQFFSATHADIVGLQEIFFSGDCANLPPEAKPGFVCEDWQPGDPTVAQVILGEDFAVACHQGKADKCLAVRKAFGTIRGCDSNLCLDGLDGAEVAGCGSGSRVGRAIVDLADGGELTVVNVHGTSGIAQDDQDCRAAQFALVFADLGDGAPAVSGERNIVLGDFNTDPGRNADFDESAAYLVEQTGPGKPFRFVTPVGKDATPTYAKLFNIDHVISDAFGGSCSVAGVSEGYPAVSEVLYFDHKPHVCSLVAR